MSSLTAAFLVLVMAVGAAVLAGVRALAGRPPHATAHAAVTAAGALAGWLALSGLLAHLDLLVFHPTRPPLVLALVLVPILAGLASARSQRGRAWLAATPAAWLIGLQAFRLPLELLLWRLHAEGLMPARMTFAGRNFDILVGATAPAFAWLATRGRLPRWAEAGWHVAGFALLLNVGTIAFQSVPSPLRQYFDDVPLTLPATFPWIWLPALLVPIAFLSHVFGLARLALTRAAVSTAAHRC